MAKRRPIEHYVDENGCHICTSHPGGRTTINGISMNVHHYIYKTKVGEVPSGKIVVRKCGNRRCINPDHLTLTTQEEETAKIAKKRLAHPIDFDVDPMTNCYNCTSHPLNKDGYPMIKVNRKRYRVYRFVYEQMFGEIPKGMVIRHKCDNRRCINPEHLCLGTQLDNIRDMVERGRASKGSKHKDAKLTEEDVREIRRRVAAGEKKGVLAREYNVSRTVIHHICIRKTWKHVD